jgi:hypothetical protein
MEGGWGEEAGRSQTASQHAGGEAVTTGRCLADRSSSSIQWQPTNQPTGGREGGRAVSVERTTLFLQFSTGDEATVYRSEEELGRREEEGREGLGFVARPVIRSQWRLDDNFLSSAHKGTKTTPPHPPHWISLCSGFESIDLALEDGFDLRKGGDIMEVPDYRSFISMSNSSGQ